MPTFPNDLQTAVNMASMCLQDDPDHNLRPYYRLEIYKVLDWRVRGMLAVLTVRRHLDIWFAARPSDKLPESWLATAEDFIKGRLAPEQARHEYDIAMDIAAIEGMRPDIEQLLNENWRAGFVLCGAREALSEALQEYGFDSLYTNHLTPDNTDDDIEAWNRDAAMWIADAYSDKSGFSESTLARRREFWMWWLKEALPLAWTLIHTPEQALSDELRYRLQPDP